MSKLSAYLTLARPHQYVKNGFVFFPLFFGHKLNQPEAVLATVKIFVAFCLTASAVYAFNDLRDIEADRQHPIKKTRPLAAGVLTRAEAGVFSAVLLLAGLGASLGLLGGWAAALVAAYLALNLAYSFKLKHLAIIDVVCVAVGFVLRVFGGGLAAQVWISHWLVLMTFLLALFLALAKRRDDLLLAQEGHNLRGSLDGYSLEFVSLSMVIMAAVLIVGYILYTVSPEVVGKHGTSNLYLTTVFVIVGLLRYLQITLVMHKSGAPTMVFLTDFFLQTVVGLWFISFYLLLYVGRQGP